MGSRKGARRRLARQRAATWRQPGVAVGRAGSNRREARRGPPRWSPRPSGAGLPHAPRLPRGVGRAQPPAQRSKGRRHVLRLPFKGSHAPAFPRGADRGPRDGPNVRRVDASFGAYPSRVRTRRRTPGGGPPRVARTGVPRRGRGPSQQEVLPPRRGERRGEGGALRTQVSPGPTDPWAERSLGKPARSAGAAPPPGSGREPGAERDGAGGDQEHRSEGYAGAGGRRLSRPLALRQRDDLGLARGRR